MLVEVAPDVAVRRVICPQRLILYAWLYCGSKPRNTVLGLWLNG